MAITGDRTIARADMNDQFGVTVWQEKKMTDYTTEEARQLAKEIIRAADEADRIAAEDAPHPITANLVIRGDMVIL